jgi:hypothetical protein
VEIATIMRSRFEGWQQQSSAHRLIFDRSVDEDARVFCRLHHDKAMPDAGYGLAFSSSSFAFDCASDQLRVSALYLFW